MRLFLHGLSGRSHLLKTLNEHGKISASTTSADSCNRNNVFNRSRSNRSSSTNYDKYDCNKENGSYCTGSSSIFSSNSNNNDTSKYDELLISAFDFDDQFLCEAICDFIERRKGINWKQIKLQNCRGQSNFGRVLRTILQADVSRLEIIETTNNRNKTTSSSSNCTTTTATTMTTATSTTTTTNATNDCYMSSFSSTILDAVGVGLISGSQIQSILIHLHGPYTRRSIATLSLGLISTTTLEELALRSSYTMSELMDGKTTMDTITAMELANGLQSNWSIQSLDLVGCNLNSDAISKILVGIQHHPLLVKLNLYGNQCLHYSPSAKIALEDLLKSNRIIELNIGFQVRLHYPYYEKHNNNLRRNKRNNFDNNGQQQQQRSLPIVRIIAQLLKDQTNTSLQSLLMCENQFSDKDITYLVHALKQNTSLEQLELSNCQLSENSILQIKNSIPDMKGIKRFQY